MPEEDIVDQAVPELAEEDEQDYGNEKDENKSKHGDSESPANKGHKPK